MKKCVVGTVAAGVGLLVASYVIGMVPFVESSMHNDHGFSLEGAISALAHGAIVATVLGWRGVGDWMDGLKGGAVYGAVVSVAMSVAAMSFDAGLVGDAIGSAVVVGVAGAAMAVAGGMAGD